MLRKEKGIENERERERERERGGERRAGKKKFLKQHKIPSFLFFFKPLSYCAQPLLAVYCSCRAKLFDFGFINVAIYLYLMVLKIAI